MSNAERMRAVVAARKSKPVAAAPPPVSPATAAAVPPPPAAGPAARKKGGPKPRPPEYHDNVHAVKGRLPDGAGFQARYDAAAKAWTGTLSVPTAAGVVPFEGTAKGVFTLLHQLDDQYRDHSRKQPAPAA